MAKIKDCVVIEQDLLMEVIKVLGLNQQTELSNKLLFNHRKLEPIVINSYFFKGVNNDGFDDYLNDTEI